MAERLPVAGEDPTIGKLVADVSRNVSTLMRQEIKLAKSELQVSAKAGGLSIGLFVGAAFVGLLGIILFSEGLAWLITRFTGWAPVWGFLIVAGVYFLLAAVLGLLGKKKMSGVRKPERAIAQAQETKAVLKRG